MRETSPNEKMAIIQTVVGFFNLGAALLSTLGTDIISFVLMAFNFVCFGWTINSWGTTIKVFFGKQKQEQTKND